MSSDEQIYESVRDYYGKVLSHTSDLKTSACTACGKPPKHVMEALKLIPNEILDKFYGCGNPIPTGIENLHVLDLGSGSGRDCYVAAKMVGEHGAVTGIDMTDEQLSVAREHVDTYTKQKLGYKQPNLQFVKGYIEFLEKAGIAPNSIDLVISNCVVNLSPNKEQVLKSVFNVLKEGGEMHFSDVYSDRKIPTSVREHKILYGECISGALYINDFIHLCKKVGFEDPRMVSKTLITIDDPSLQDLLGETKFYSITYRLFKLKNLEMKCEDYGQVAIYKGTLPDSKHSYILDDHHKFETNKPALVCGNTASMLSETWLKNHFTITGDRSVHYGEFDCSNSKSVSASSSSSACAVDCSSGGCC